MKYVCLVLFGLLAAPAAADDYDIYRNSCTHIWTAIYSKCKITRIYRCNDGSVFFEDERLADVPSAQLYGPDYQLIVISRDGQDLLRIIGEPADRFSMATFLATGAETADVRVHNYFIPDLPHESRMARDVQMTGETLTITGHTLPLAVTHTTLEMGFGGNSVVFEGYDLVDAENGVLIGYQATGQFMGQKVDDLPKLMALFGRRDDAFTTQDPYPFCADPVS